MKASEPASVKPVHRAQSTGLTEPGSDELGHLSREIAHGR